MRQKWNKRYKERGPENFRQEPSDWLKTHLPDLKQLSPGKALDIACGNGRNAHFLAQLGFEVDAFDISDVAIDWLSEKVKAESLAIHPKVVDLTQYQLPKAHYQVIINFNYLDRNIFEAMQASLVPGGLLLFETFTVDHMQTLGRSISPDFVLASNELIQAFPDLRVLHYREGMRSNEKGKAIASYLGQKM